MLQSLPLRHSDEAVQTGSSPSSQQVAKNGTTIVFTACMCFLLTFTLQITKFNTRKYFKIQYLPIPLSTATDYDNPIHRFL